MMPYCIIWNNIVKLLYMNNIFFAYVVILCNMIYCLMKLYRVILFYMIQYHIIKHIWYNIIIQYYEDIVKDGTQDYILEIQSLDSKN